MRDKHTYQQQISTSYHITACLCVSAAQLFLPTMVVFESSIRHRKSKDGISENWLATTDNGYMDRELFFIKFERTFMSKV